MNTNTKLPKVIPFFSNPSKYKNNDEFPTTFPFHLYFDKELGIFRHRSNKALRTLLDEAYVKGSVLDGGMTDSIVGKKRVDDAIAFIKKHYNVKKGVKVLEIGCGDGYVLQKLAKFKVDSVGLEPGPQVLKLSGNGITVINDFFPSNHIKGTFDLILHFGVMEHIDDPAKFLKQQKELLTENGAIICAVPNCEPDMAAGDISLFYHQHYNYFTKYGIFKAARKAGLYIELVQEGDAGGLLFAKITQNKVSPNIQLINNYNEQHFLKKFTTFNKAVTDFFTDTRQPDVAVYCPLRAMNLFYALKITDCRLVDDNISIQGKYLPAFTKKIENFESLVKKPPKKLLIYSRTFEKLLKEKCQKVKAFSNTEIKSVSDLL